MVKTFRVSFSLKNTYRVNAILFSLRQIPGIRRLLPQKLYGVRGLKIFANVLAILYELATVFAFKFLYLLAVVCGIGALYQKQPGDTVFLHILLLFTVIGSFANTSLFNPSRDKYYAINIMRMDARRYTLVDYLYYSLKVVIGLLPFTVFFGRDKGLPLWLCLLLPFCIAGIKAFYIFLTLLRYEKRGVGYNENRLSGPHWVLIILLAAAAYGLPLLGWSIPMPVSAGLFLLGLPLGALGFAKLFAFRDFRAINKELLANMANRNEAALRAAKTATEKRISNDPGIHSERKGFEYLNELFIKRHRKMLWKPSKAISLVSLLLFAGLQIVLLFIAPEIKPDINVGVMNCLPYFLFIMYLLNRGTGFTQALFMNCDHSLLTYAFFKKPNFILRLFLIRLREIMKVNAVPALVIGGGLALTLYNSGGTAQPLNYLVLVVSVLCMSLFFSVHYLTLYYLLQPYNAGTEMKSGTYRIVCLATYFVCYFLMQRPVPTMLFGLLTIAFVVAYCIVAGILVYYRAPTTFRLRA